MLPRPLPVVDARQFDKDAAAAYTLDIRLGHPELVNPLADDAFRVRDGGFRFIPKDVNNLRIGGLRWEEVLVLQVMEDAPELTLSILLRPSSRKEIDEFRPGSLRTARPSLSYGGLELRICRVIAQGDDEVRNTHFEGHAHAPLQVEAEVELLFDHLLVGVAENGVDLCVRAVAKELAGSLPSGFLSG